MTDSKNELQTQASRFTQQTPTMKPQAMSRFTPSFAVPGEKERNIFFKQTAQALKEYRILSDRSDARGPLSKEEREEIRTLLKEARKDTKTYKIPLEMAAALRFASQEAGLDHTAYMNRLNETEGNVAANNAGGLSKSALFKFNVSNWLYLVKTYGPDHGLDYFADKITVQNKGSHFSVHVDDPAVLRQISEMRENPRISAIMGAEYIKNHSEHKLLVGYEGIGIRSDTRISAQQSDLLTLGFDIGVRGTDGFRGPLTQAALEEFIHMSKVSLASGKPLDQVLHEAAVQAKEDAAKYTNKYREVSPADAFAIRNAAKVVGADFGYMMELANAESGFKTEIKASTSSATGLFQFIDNTWLTMLYKHGEKYGLGDIVSQIETTKDKNGNVVTAKIDDPLIQKYALGLRKDPRISSLMGAEFAKENMDNLKGALPKQKINRTDQYLAHFLGSGNAANFISQMKKNPDKPADTVFPAAAGSNEGVFYKPDNTPRSLKEVYDHFKRKFDTTQFDEKNERHEKQKRHMKKSAGPDVSTPTA